MPIEVGKEVKTGGVAGQTGITETANAEAVLEQFRAFAQNTTLVSVPQSVLESMALAIQTLTDKANLLGAENKDLRGQLEKTQASLKTQTAESKHDVVGNYTFSTFANKGPALVQKIEAAAKKLGLDDHTISWSSASVTLKVTGSPTNVAKLEEWSRYWAGGGTNAM